MDESIDIKNHRIHYSYAHDQSDVFFVKQSPSILIKTGLIIFRKFYKKWLIKPIDPQLILGGVQLASNGKNMNTDAS